MCHFLPSTGVLLGSLLFHDRTCCRPIPLVLLALSSLVGNGGVTAFVLPVSPSDMTGPEKKDHVPSFFIDRGSTARSLRYYRDDPDNHEPKQKQGATKDDSPRPRWRNQTAELLPTLDNYVKQGLLPTTTTSTTTTTTTTATTTSGSSRTTPDHQGTDAPPPPSSSSFLFTEFLNIEAFLRIAKNFRGNTTMAAEGLFKQVMDRLEELLHTTTTSVADLASFVHWAGDIVSANNKTKQEETRQFATQLLAVTDGLLSKGYVQGDPLAGKEEAILQDMHASDGNGTNKQNDNKSSNKPPPEALFEHFKSATEINGWSHYLDEVNTMAQMASIIYNDEQTRVSKLLIRGQSVVAEGITAHVRWIVTDSLVRQNNDNNNNNKHKSNTRLIRTVTIRGFDASDQSVNREELFSTICCLAQPELLRTKKNQKVLVHSGLLQTAQLLYQDLKRYLVDWLSPDTQVLLLGHSIGGALSTLLLFLITLDQGPEFAKQRIQKVYTFGAPPVAAVENSRPQKQKDDPNLLPENHNNDMQQKYPCDILTAFGLPSTIVHGYIQPWDPIPRLFTNMDPLYPLIGDIDMENGDDGMTVWPSGPPRTLRPVVNAIIEAWGDGWSRFRDDFRKNCNQTYSSVGVQHLFLPEPTRYLIDRFISVDIAVPPIQTILRLSSADLSPALDKAFPLDTFRISYVAPAIRSFVHHFYPAYSEPLQDYVNRLDKEQTRRKHTEKYDIYQENGGEDADDDDRPCYIMGSADYDAAQILLTSLQQENEWLAALVPATDLQLVDVAASGGGGGGSVKSERHGQDSRHSRKGEEQYKRQEEEKSTRRLRPWRGAARWFRRNNHDNNKNDGLAP